RKLQFAERLASLGRTVQAVAHELNTPLATIQTLAADMKAALAHAPPEARELARDLDESASLILDEMRRCRSITQGLLAGRDRLENSAKDGDLRFAIERAATLVLGTGSSRRVLVCDPALEGLLVSIDADALADRPEGRIRISKIEAEPGFVGVCVDDDGPGFPLGVRDRLFEPFYTTKPPGKGTGLGLYTAQSLLREAGGRIELADAPGGGARVVLHLPEGARD